MGSVRKQRLWAIGDVELDQVLLLGAVRQQHNGLCRARPGVVVSTGPLCGSSRGAGNDAGTNSIGNAI